MDLTQGNLGLLKVSARDLFCGEFSHFPPFGYEVGLSYFIGFALFFILFLLAVCLEVEN